MSRGRDGSFYRDENERIRADARYNQQERLIEQQKIQNKLLKQQIDKEKQKELYNGVQNWSGHDMLMFIKTMFYIACIVCFIPMRFTDVAESFNLVLNIILIIFRIVFIYDIYKIIKKYKTNNSNQNQNKK